jgi:hypothetical protein
MRTRGLSLKRTAAVFAVLACAAAVPAAVEAHVSDRWYWPAQRAEDALWMHQKGVNVASCDGLGRPYHGMWRHFECATYDKRSRYRGAGVLHVLGRDYDRYAFYLHR